MQKKLDVITTTEETVEDILSKVDLSSVEDIRPEELKKPAKKTKKDKDPGTDCWHESCSNRAAKRVHASKEFGKLGHRFVHNKLPKFPLMNQLCLEHFNSSEYKLQKMFVSITEDV